MNQSAPSPSSSPVGRRDERLNSIYDKYLYDPRDLGSNDPVLRKLARTASLDRRKQLQYQEDVARRKQVAPNQLQLESLDEDPTGEGGIRLEDMSSGQDQRYASAAASAASAFAKVGSASKQARGGPTFADDAKREDGNGSRPAGGERQSVDAWAAVGGLMTGGLSDFDDSSDDERGPPRRQAAGRLEKQQQQQQPPSDRSHPPPSASAGREEPQNKTVRASWTSRAAAVGSRPPDSASQNPPTLKLLGLKSIKEGGAPIGGATSPSQPSYGAMRSPVHGEGGSNESELSSRQQILSVSDYGDRDQDRHGSTINFGGGATSPFGPPRPVGNRGTQLNDPPTPSFGPTDPLRPPISPGGGERPVSPRTNDLTKQLGLGGSSPALGPVQTHGARPQQAPAYHQQQQQQPPQFTQAPRAPAAAYAPNERARIGSQSSNGGSSPTRALLPHTASTSSGASSPRDPFHDSVGSVPLQRGPGPLQQQQQAPQGRGMANMAHPSHMMPGRPGGPPQPPQAPQPPQPPRSPMGPPPQAPRPPPGYQPNGDGRGGPPQPPMMARPQPPQQPRGPPTQPGRAPGFSDSPGPSRGNGDPRRQSLFRRSMAFVMGNGADGGQGLNVAGQGGNGNGNGPQRRPSGNRRSILRRSMAFLSGRPMPPQPPQPQQRGGPPADDDANAPQPRVQGFVDEKPRDRKSTYLGAGGMGDEWDYGGAGARFWNRFNKAQEKSNQMDPASDAYRRKAVKGRRTAQAGATVGLIVIVGLVIGIVVWREGIKADPNAIPGAIDRNTGGTSTGQTYLVAQSSPTSSSSTRKHRNTSTANNNAKRAEPTAVAAILERAALPADLGSGQVPSLQERQASLFDGAMVKRRMRDHRRRGATPVPRSTIPPVMDELDG